MTHDYFPKGMLVLAAVVFFVMPLRAQSPEPVVVQAIAPASGSSVTPAAAPNPTPGSESRTILPFLQEMKAANDEALKKQAATLQTLDELQKAAELIKIYGKRG